MSFKHRNDGAHEHAEVSALLAWYVNGTAGEAERRRVDEHLVSCRLCRDDLERECAIHRTMNAEPALEYMPAASLRRLQARLDAADAAPNSIAAANSQTSTAPRELRRTLHWHGLMAASVAVMAVALCVLATNQWLEIRAKAAGAEYHTVTTSVARPANEVIRAVFAPNITLTELQSILDQAQLRIVSGPTEAGVYSLAANSHRPVFSSLMLLRAHAKVRFAESTQPPADAP